MNEENAVALRVLLDADARLARSDISQVTGLSDSSVWRILHSVLKCRKLYACWVPRLLRAEQKAKRIACAQSLLDMFGPGGKKKRLTDVITGDESWFSFWQLSQKRRTWSGWHPERSVHKSVRSRPPRVSSYKRFFSPSIGGPRDVDFLPEQSTVTATSYGEIVNAKLIQAIEGQRPKVGAAHTFLLHNNTSSHKAASVLEKLAQKEISVLENPPHSPDFAPCDLWLFPRIKFELADSRFARMQGLARAIWSILRRISESESERSRHRVWKTPRSTLILFGYEH